MAVTGRPTKYSDKTAKAICKRLMLGESLRQICRDDKMPGLSTVCDWLATEGHEFPEQYARARRIQAELQVDEMCDIADDGTNDWMEREGKDGESLGWTVNGEHIQRSRLRIDTRKWAASKMLPKKYGERTQHDHGVSDELSELLRAVSGNGNRIGSG